MNFAISTQLWASTVSKTQVVCDWQRPSRSKRLTEICLCYANAQESICSVQRCSMSLYLPHHHCYHHTTIAIDDTFHCHGKVHRNDDSTEMHSQMLGAWLYSKSHRRTYVRVHVTINPVFVQYGLGRVRVTINPVFVQYGLGRVRVTINPVFVQYGCGRVRVTIFSYHLPQHLDSVRCLED